MRHAYFSPLNPRIILWIRALSWFSNALDCDFALLSSHCFFIVNYFLELLLLMVLSEIIRRTRFYGFWWYLLLTLSLEYLLWLWWYLLLWLCFRGLLLNNWNWLCLCNLLNCRWFLLINWLSKAINSLKFFWLYIV